MSLIEECIYEIDVLDLWSKILIKKVINRTRFFKFNNYEKTVQIIYKTILPAK